jgi:hypothetical protein
VVSTKSLGRHVTCSRSPDMDHTVAVERISARVITDDSLSTGYFNLQRYR